MPDSNKIIDGKRLVFLVGAPRSGTTWLQLMLARSKHVATANETHLFAVYMQSLLEGNERFRGNPRAIGLAPLFSEAEYRGIVREFSSAVLARILATKPDADVILEKTPSHVTCWRDILDLYPEARFLHLIRDPRAVVASLKAASKSWGKSWVSSRLIDNCALWSTSVAKGREIGGATTNYLEVRYEDLKQHGARTLPSILEWIGVASSARECLGLLEDTSIERLRSASLKDAPWDIAGEPRGFYREGEAASWRKVLSEFETFLVEAQVREMMTALGYQPEARSRTLFRIGHASQVAVLERARAALRWRAIRRVRALVSRALAGSDRRDTARGRVW
jgi:Sulfotransferase family